MLQQVPPPPAGPQSRNPTPPGDVVPVDGNVWILMAVAVAIMMYIFLPRLKKAN